MNGKEATNQAAAAFDDTELKCLLLGDENERQKAGDTLLQQFGFRLMGKLRRFSLLSDDEKGSVIHDTIIEVLKKAEKADLDLDQPLIGLLLCICQCKAIDLTRQKTRETGKDDELTEEIGEALADTQVGVAWKHAISNEDAPAIRDEFLAFVQTLPPRQKLVGAVLAGNFGFTLSQEEIAQKIYQATGRTVSKIEIKGALAAVRQKFKTILKRKFPDLPLTL
jgi:DNA-directed RNA polymerase specialized sigma24 family protein